MRSIQPESHLTVVRNPTFLGLFHDFLTYRSPPYTHLHFLVKRERTLKACVQSIQSLDSTLSFLPPPSFSLGPFFYSSSTLLMFWSNIPHLKSSFFPRHPFLCSSTPKEASVLPSCLPVLLSKPSTSDTLNG